jgi:CheY-like chemotaxis protein
LTRVLERYELAVDGVESAEQALEYLAHQNPDVIFMDHLMPGMDGFQAVQAIKNNPRTATIPIMMYTSQEGELYLSQARALGAIGVLPKQIKHTDVSRALDQLKLLGDLRPESELETLRAHTLATDADPPPDITVERRAPQRPQLPPMPPELRSIMEAMLTHHVRDLRRFMVDNLETHADRIVGDVRLLLEEAPASEALPAPRRANGLGMLAVAVLAAVALIVAALFAWQWSAQRNLGAGLSTQLARTQQQLGDTQRELQALRVADAAAAASAMAPPDEAGGPAELSTSIEPVPFGEPPLAGARVEHIGALLARLKAEDFHGTVRIRSIPGRFCMVTGAAGQPVLASDVMPYSRCEQVAAPREYESDSQRQSVAFANMLALARAGAAGRYTVELSAGSPEEALTPYPPVSDTLSAGEWNRAAAANNRVEVRWQAAP